MEVSRVEVVVLALLAEQPMYGYELLERFRDRGMGAWAEVGKASVYQALRRLENEKLLSGREQPGEGPERRVYRITRSGRERLRGGLLERFAVGGPYEIESNITLGFAHLLTVDQLRKGIASRKTRISELQARIKLARSAAPPSPLTNRMLDLQEAVARAELAWLTAFARDAGKLRR